MVGEFLLLSSRLCCCQLFAEFTTKQIKIHQEVDNISESPVKLEPKPKTPINRSINERGKFRKELVPEPWSLGSKPCSDEPEPEEQRCGPGFRE